MSKPKKPNIFQLLAKFNDSSANKLFDKLGGQPDLLRSIATNFTPAQFESLKKAKTLADCDAIYPDYFRNQDSATVAAFWIAGVKPAELLVSQGVGDSPTPPTHIQKTLDLLREQEYSASATPGGVPLGQVEKVSQADKDLALKAAFWRAVENYGYSRRNSQLKSNLEADYKGTLGEILTHKALGKSLSLEQLVTFDKGSKWSLGCDVPNLGGYACDIKGVILNSETGARYGRSDIQSPEIAININQPKHYRLTYQNYIEPGKKFDTKPVDIYLVCMYDEAQDRAVVMAYNSALVEKQWARAFVPGREAQGFFTRNENLQKISSLLDYIGDVESKSAGFLSENNKFLKACVETMAVRVEPEFRGEPYLHPDYLPPAVFKEMHNARKRALEPGKGSPTVSLSDVELLRNTKPQLLKKAPVVVRKSGAAPSSPFNLGALVKARDGFIANEETKPTVGPSKQQVR